MKAVILLGAPGAGKGTVASTVVRERRFEHFSTGDMLRESVRNMDEVGKFAKDFMERGEYQLKGVPGSWTLFSVEA